MITASKGVAFEIEFERSSSFHHGLPRTPPKKFTVPERLIRCSQNCFRLLYYNFAFQRLAPLSNAPKFTADQLEEKIKQAEENRQRVILYFFFIGFTQSDQFIEDKYH